MSVRINQRWPDGLKERIEEQVGPKGVTGFTVEALEEALEVGSDQPTGGTALGPRDDAHPSPAASPRTSDLEREGLRNMAESMHDDAARRIASRRCINVDCDYPLPTSPKVIRCQCGGRLVG